MEHGFFFLRSERISGDRSTGGGGFDGGRCVDGVVVVAVVAFGDSFKDTATPRFDSDDVGHVEDVDERSQAVYETADSRMRDDS